MKSKIIFFLFLLFPLLAATAQGIEVKGTVVSSEDGMPLPGASVIAEGTTNSASTDIDGNFTLTNVTPGAVLSVSYIGFQTQTIAAQATVTVTLKSGNKELEAVVVTGYSTQRKTDIIGAVAVVDMKALNKQVAPNPIQALQGRVAGVRVTTDGSPSGSNTNVVIRGVTTINTTSRPLLVIDGVPTQAGMHELNPNDIETIKMPHRQVFMAHGHLMV